GLHPMNLGRLVLNANKPIHTPLPCTPRAVIELAERHGLDFRGKDVVVVGRGITVGRSIGALLTRREYNATVTLCHTGTADLPAQLRRADVIVAAAGAAPLVRAEDVKPGAVVFDVGVSRREDPAGGRATLVGDVDPAVAEVAGWLSPHPGGGGPLTRALLLKNVDEAAERAAEVQEPAWPSPWPPSPSTACGPPRAGGGATGSPPPPPPSSRCRRGAPPRSCSPI